MIQTAIVLGYCLNDDNSMDPILVERLNLLLRLNQEESLDYIIVSGGVANPNSNKSEAEVMKDYLLKHGISEEKIILENQSMTTIENARYSVPIAKKLHTDRYFIVTSPFHLYRSSLSAVLIFNSEINDDSKVVLYYTCATK